MQKIATAIPPNSAHLTTSYTVRFHAFSRLPARRIAYSYLNARSSPLGLTIDSSGDAARMPVNLCQNAEKPVEAGFSRQSERARGMLPTHAHAAIIPETVTQFARLRAYRTC